MKYIRWLIILTTLFEGIALAQQDTGYVWSTVSVTSATTPVQCLSAAALSGFIIAPRASAAANPILAWSYKGTTVPTAVPSACASPSATFTTGGGCKEIVAGGSLSDSVVCDAPSCRNGMGQPYACVLEAGSSAETVDSGTK